MDSCSHSCSNHYSCIPEELEEAVRAAEASDFETIKALILKQDRVFFNEARGLIQVRECARDLIVAQIPVPPEYRALLVSPLP
jgi:hypothetical protein